MKVLHLSTSGQGGAGLSAARLALLQRKQGMQVKLLTRGDQGELGSKWVTNFKIKQGKAVTFIHNQISDKDSDLLTPFSVSSLGLNRIIGFNPDIIHIHNWYNLLSVSDIKKLGKRFPIVVTMHDERLLTGGCHITLGCTRFNSGCKRCPRVSGASWSVSNSRKNLAEVMSDLPRFGVISPSKWLLENAEKSGLLRNAIQYEIIPNSIGQEIEFLQDKYVSPLNATIRFLFVAADLSAKVKNIQVAMLALEILANKYSEELKIEFHIVGANFSSTLNPPKNLSTYWHGYGNEGKIQQLMNFCDALLITSLSENSPNIIGEAQLRGLIVISTHVGGIPELIESGVNGFLSEGSAESVSSKLAEFISFPKKFEMARKAHESASSRWNEESIASSHSKFYLGMNL